MTQEYLEKKKILRVASLRLRVARGPNPTSYTTLEKSQITCTLNSISCITNLTENTLIINTLPPQDKPVTFQSHVQMLQC